MSGRTSNLGVAPAFAHSQSTEQFCYHNAGASGLGGSSYIDDTVLRDRDTDANGTLDERRYYLQNQHHDVVALVNTSGSISERVNYDPYGSPIGTFTSIANRKGYAGYDYDAELGDTYHVRHRVYRSDLGVWTRRDPLGYVDGMGLYQYAAGSPYAHFDPFGLASQNCDLSNASECIRQWACMICTTYGEVRNQGNCDSLILWAIYNRANDKHKRWPRTPCGVVEQPAQWDGGPSNKSYWDCICAITGDKTLPKDDNEALERMYHFFDLQFTCANGIITPLPGVTDPSGGANHCFLRGSNPMIEQSPDCTRSASCGTKGTPTDCYRCGRWGSGDPNS